MATITVRLSDEESEQLQTMVSPDRSVSDVVRQALFKRRERVIKELPPLIELKGQSRIANKLAGIREAYRRKEDITLDLRELSEDINATLKF